MQRLPTEIYDHIVSYVEGFDENPDYEDPHLYSPMYLLHKDAQAALSNLRLVDKTFSRSASRALFGRVRARLGHGVSSFPKLETLSSSKYAKFVRFIHFDIVNIDPYLEEDEDEEEDREEDEDEDREGHEDVDEGGFRLSDQALNHLSSLIAEFCNLKAFSVWADEFMPPNKAIGFHSQILTTIAHLQLRGFIHRVSYLRMAIDGGTHLITLLDNGDHQIAIQHFLQQIQHLDMIGFNGDINIGGAPTELTDLETLIKSSSNLLSLSIFGYYTSSISLIKFNPGLSFRLESLDLFDLKIGSYDLLALLEACKDSMRFITLDRIELLSGTWLHILVQIKKNLLKLITFLFMENDPFLEELVGDDSRYQHCVLWHAVGDIQRQTNANRLDAGLKPWTSAIYMFLQFPSLEVGMKKESYEELISRNWDAEGLRTS